MAKLGYKYKQSFDKKIFCPRKLQAKLLRGAAKAQILRSSNRYLTRLAVMRHLPNFMGNAQAGFVKMRIFM
jgi:hypothetical protein